MQIQMFQNNNRSTSFGAKLDVSNLGSWRWNKISENFEKKTKEYPNDTLSISVQRAFGKFSPSPDGVYDKSGFIIRSEINNEGVSISDKGYLTDKGTGLLTALEDDVIVDKLVDLHKVLRKDSDMLIDAKKFFKNFKRRYKDARIETAEDKFNDAINDARTSSINADLSKDNIWVNFNPRR